MVWQAGAWRRYSVQRGAIMIWETPVAIDLRFGMEITMYADHR
jgi:coenzyme PQQ precursor peptide PqqA